MWAATVEALGDTDSLNNTGRGAEIFTAHQSEKRDIFKLDTVTLKALNLHNSPRDLAHA
ncbi:hypothetical protein EXN66_Car002740 [Channa argus]|uniref:Uncharacterized protein n=1 Tax=Channa argus TaxID=215402 RepID=A0A6G1PAK7_CHAAH|nr:hypothetical protein EXN66_Car002740 [Channa argus]